MKKTFTITYEMCYITHRKSEKRKVDRDDDRERDF